MGLGAARLIFCRIAFIHHCFVRLCLSIVVLYLIGVSSAYAIVSVKGMNDHPTQYHCFFPRASPVCPPWQESAQGVDIACAY